MRHVVELRKCTVLLHSWDSSSLGFLYAPDNLWAPERKKQPDLAAGVGTAQGAVLNEMGNTSPYLSTNVHLDWLNAASCEPNGDSMAQVPWARCG
jgi:hypothetical protein